MPPISFADRYYFAATRRARQQLARAGERLLALVACLAAERRAERRRCWAPCPAMGERAMTRQLRWPWCGGYVSLAEAAGLRRIATTCNLLTVPTCSAPNASFSNINPAALAA